VKLTNRNNLPETIINVIKRPEYNKGKSNMSVTELLNSPRIVQLKRKHWEELTEDASDMVWSIFGTAIHGVLEHGKGENHVVEERIHVVVDNVHISGAIDLQEIEEDGIIVSDYKTTSAWAVINEKQDWHNQLNSYAYLVEAAKKTPVKKLQIVAIVRDWNRREAATREGYPTGPIVVIDIPLWSFADREAYVRGRISLHGNGFFETETGGEVSDCTSDEMWERQTSYALKKEGNVRAKSVHQTEEDAAAALANAEKSAKKNEKFLVEVRPGERVRCQSFCQVSPYCSQHQSFTSGNSDVQFPHQLDQYAKSDNANIPS
jgi:hypothetical protein